ncbi:hypothetical protein HDU91_003995 [Kappamyces sp. JEL0680]|nr:hypothetical protein HDU91_003995 [Kappamyces sp. JEL0680]
MLTAQDSQHGIWNRYQALTLIGQGVYGKVIKALSKVDKRVVAIKETCSDTDGILATTLREISIMTRIKHRNVVEYDKPNLTLEADQCMINNQVYMVMEYCSQDLFHFLSKRSGLSSEPKLAQTFLDHILAGLAEIHKHGMMHRDIKPQNILVASCQGGKYLCKIADFGLGRRSTGVLGSFTPETQTMLYRAPELFAGIPKYHYAIDVWSVGCVFAEMMRGEPLFRGSREIELFHFIQSTLGRPTKEEWMVLDPEQYQEHSTYDEEKPDLGELVPGLNQNGLDLLQKMFTYNPADRITAQDARKHQYFDDYQEDLDLQVLQEKV